VGLDATRRDEKVRRRLRPNAQQLLEVVVFRPAVTSIISGIGILLACRRHLYDCWLVKMHGRRRGCCRCCIGMALRLQQSDKFRMMGVFIIVGGNRRFKRVGRLARWCGGKVEIVTVVAGG
jgi:hypothetical protein